MGRFGRFTLGKEQPDEIYKGDTMKLEKGCVMIFKGDEAFALVAELVAVVRLDKGQSVRQMSMDCDEEP